MFHRKRLLNIVACGLFYATVVGCQSMPVTPLPKGASPSEEINKLQADQQTAAGQQVDVLSPGHFDKSRKALDEAKKSREAGDKPEATLQLVAEGHAYLKKALEAADIARTSLANAVERRAEALKVDAPKYAKKLFDDADEELKKATAKIEDNDTSLALKSHDSLAKSYENAKIAAIKEAQLGPAQRDIEQAQKEEAKKYVPRTLSGTLVIFAEAGTLIDRSPDTPSAWQAKSEAARTAAARLLKFTRDGKTIGGRDPESMLLLREENENKIAAKTAALHEAEQKLEQKQSAIESLEREKKQLTSSEKFNDLFTKAHQMFSAGEADVYRQGDKLLIRLKGLEFAKGSTEILPKNYDTLNKVGQAIKSFGKSHVVVEGHTDSSGSEPTNQKLSEKRASAVAQYLTVNASIPQESIKSAGFGYQKPIASNKTAEGRAQNRRVDIIVEADNSGL